MRQGHVTVPTKNGAFLIREVSWHLGLRLPFAWVENLELMGAMIYAGKGVNQHLIGNHHLQDGSK